MPLTPNQITIIAVSITASVTLITAIITAVLTFRANALSRENEHKLAVLKVLLEAGYKEYEFKTKADIEEAKLSGKALNIKSFTEYVIFYREMADVFSKKTVTEKDIMDSLEKNKNLINTYYLHREIQRPEYHKKN